MFVWWLLLIALFLPQCPCDYYNGYRPQNQLISFEEINEENQLIHALNKILNFFYFDIDNVNVDGLMGIIVAEAQLNVILSNLETENSLYDEIYELKLKCRTLNKHLKKSIRMKNPKHQKIFDNLLRTNIWELPSMFIDKSLSDFSPYNWTNTSYSKLVRLFFKGQPSGNQSDYCIGEILNSVHQDPKQRECIPSSGCHRAMSDLTTSHGYPLTHKLLYIQISRALKCKLDHDVVMESMSFLCARILREFRAIENYPRKTAMLQDLYLEQMVLCGLEGFTEFVSQTSRKNLLDWQTTYGCYGREFRNYDERWRSKRSITAMKYGCESHITGLAAAAIAVNLNYLISFAVLDSAEEYSNVLMFI